MSKMSFLSFHHTTSRNPTVTNNPKPPTSVTNSYSSKPSINKQPIIQNNIPSNNNKINNFNYQPNNKEMKKVFDKFDTNGDGKISLDEYKRALGVLGGGGPSAKSEAAQSFGEADLDGDGFIDFEEFLHLHISDGGVKCSEVEAAFGVFDVDGDGKISAAELMEVLKRMGERCSLDSCKKMIRGVDRDGDGLIDMDEFINMMTKTIKIV